MKPFDVYLREARKAAGLTQSELGTKLGVSSGLISKWETGTRELGGGYERLEELAAALVVPMRRLLTESDVAYTDAVLAYRRLRSATWQPAAVACTAIAMGTVIVEAGVLIGHYAVLDGIAKPVHLRAGCVVGHGVVLTGVEVGEGECVEQSRGGSRGLAGYRKGNEQ